MKPTSSWRLSCYLLCSRLSHPRPQSHEHVSPSNLKCPVSTFINPAVESFEPRSKRLTACNGRHEDDVKNNKKKNAHAPKCANASLVYGNKCSECTRKGGACQQNEQERERKKSIAHHFPSQFLFPSSTIQVDQISKPQQKFQVS